MAIDGSALANNVIGGPIFCEQGNPNQCYQPSLANSLKIIRESAQYYTVGGSVNGLTGNLILENNGGDALSLSADGSFTFPTALPPGSPYSVTVQTQPATQTCTVNNSNGTITSANVTNVTVQCTTNLYSVGGTVSGLANSESVVLQNNGGDALNISADGTFTFPTKLPPGRLFSDRSNTTSNANLYRKQW